MDPSLPNYCNEHVEMAIFPSMNTFFLNVFHLPEDTSRITVLLHFPLLQPGSAWTEKLMDQRFYSHFIRVVPCFSFLWFCEVR